MARCSRCNKFMLLGTSSGYCKECEIIVKEEAHHRAEEEKKRHEKELKIKAEEERRRQEAAAKLRSEQERKEKEEARRHAMAEQEKRRTMEKQRREGNITAASKSPTSINDELLSAKKNSEENNDSIKQPEKRSEHSDTVINPETESNQTKLNIYASDHQTVNKGTILCGKYIVEQSLNSQGGESTLYLCSFEGKEYVAKIYKRRIAIKEEVVHTLQEIRSPYVARTYDLGEYNGMPVEILPYYKLGSLAGKTYTYDEIKKMVIPSLNSGLKILHDHNIIHKDLKPSNIMLNDDGKSLAIIDFGISSIREDGNTVIVTKTGLTPEYSAPETFKNLFLNESDYYSLGITLYELFTGHTPYADMTQDDIERFVSVQRLPLPDNMPIDLQELITALTYPDITNRKDKENSNRRWGYEEVCNWCKGKKQPLPGIASGANSFANKGYRFGGKAYANLSDLIYDLAKNWEDGKKQLFRGKLWGYLTSINENEAAEICDKAMNEAETGDPDIIFFKTIYQLAPDLSKFIWRNREYSDLSDLGDEWLKDVKSGKKSMLPFITEILAGNVLSTYIKLVAPNAVPQLDVVKAIETEARMRHGAINDANAYRLGYILTDNPTLTIDKKDFSSFNEIAEYMVFLSRRSIKDLEAFASKLIHKNNVIDTQFKSWISALGKDDILGTKMFKQLKNPEGPYYGLDGQKIEKNNSVFFGRYPQSKDGTDAPIEWIVLAREGNTALLLAKNGLDVQPYAEGSNNITWENSHLRRWLNTEFINSAFEEKERECILESEIDNSQNQCNGRWRSIGGRNTEDKVFLLSYKEASREYFHRVIARQAKATPYAKARGAYTFGKTGVGWWWLRSPGADQKKVACVDYEGDVSSHGTDGQSVCVRPALWIDLWKI